MSKEPDQPRQIDRNPIMDLYDPSAYEVLRGTQTSNRSVFNQFCEGFSVYLDRLAKTDPNAQELSKALGKLPSQHLAAAISMGAEIDWTSESPISSSEELFATLKGLNNVLNDPSAQFKRDALAYSQSDSSASNEAPLTLYARYLFQNKSLGVKHGYFWGRYIQDELAWMYVGSKEKNIPEQYSVLRNYALDKYQIAMQDAANGINTRQVGISQVLGQLVGELGVLEDGDQRFDYTARQAIAEQVDDIVQRDNPEELLQTLITYIKPVDLDVNAIQGAVFKPVIINDAKGEALFNQFQRFDSFWFQPPFEDDQPAADPKTNFPNNPQIIRAYFDDDPDEASDKRVVIYKDPSYFRSDGSKVYWGDLSEKDVQKINGNYYCLSQSESFHDLPEWAVRMKSFMDNQDPNRPKGSFIDTPEGQHILPENPLLIDPNYMKAVAIGAITDGQFIANKQSCKIEFIPA